jgi:hypothetical protein
MKKTGYGLNFPEMTNITEMQKGEPLSDDIGRIYKTTISSEDSRGVQ